MRSATNFISTLIVRRAKLVALIGTLMAIVGGYYSVRLYMNLKTDILELLPTTARSVIDLDEVTRRLESIDNLAVLVFSDDARASGKFVTDLAAELSKAPKNAVASVEFKIDQELKFFKERQALYMDLEDLKQVRKYIQDRIEYEKELYNPINIFSEKQIPEPHLDFLALRKKYEGRTSTFDKLPGGYYATPDEKIRAVLVNLPGKGTPAQRLLMKTTREAIARLNPQSYAPDIIIKFTGGVTDSLEEQDALVEDLELSTVIVTVLVMLGMLVFFRSFRATAALMMSIFMGTAWTFGVSYFAVGYLNANSAFLGSIVIGNGINFGIIYLACYLEERKNHRTPSEAAAASFEQTAHATWTAALAAGLSYGSLMLTGFRGFNQFGVIGLIGMVLCWISAYTVLPAMLLLLDGSRDRKRPRGESKSSGATQTALFRIRALSSPPIMTFVSAGLGKFPGTVTVIAIGLTLVSLSTLSRLDKSIIETDLSQLRNQESMTHGSAYLTRYIDEIFQRYLSPTVILPRTRENAIKIAARIKEAKEKLGPQSSIGTVQTLDDFIPSQQDEKITVLKQIRGLLPQRLLVRLSQADRDRIAFLLDEKAFQPVKQEDLPPLLISKFTERDGSVGRMVLVEPPIRNDLNNGDNLIRFIEVLRQAADEIEPGVPVAGQLAISSDMIGAIAKDGPKATLSAFFAVVVLVIVLFREAQTIFLVLLALFLGVLWLVGIMLGFGLKINFLNFIALPITFGIGVDYGVNIFQRYSQLRAHMRERTRASTEGDSILEVVRTTGAAVTLASYSTIVGYASLLIAGNRGFVSFGRLAVAGELTCVGAAVIFLPAYLAWNQRRRKRRPEQTLRPV